MTVQVEEIRAVRLAFDGELEIAESPISVGKAALCVAYTDRSGQVLHIWDMLPALEPGISAGAH
jgi:hypothetical protein